MTDYDRYERVRATLEEQQQTHLLSFYEALSEAQQEALLHQLEQQDWGRLRELVETHVKNTPETPLPTALSNTIEPAPYYPAQPTAELETTYQQAIALGEQLIREEKVAAFTVAGGQGTRLGWDGPKGTFLATPLLHKPLFRVFAEYLLKVQRKYGAVVPWYVMTSPINDAATRAFFDEHAYFGLEPDVVMLFPQGTMPSIGLDGKLLLADKGTLAVNPDGHGGSLKALYDSGALADMQKRGIEQISYFQVDNPNVKCIDPLFLGLHVADGAEMSSKMLAKVSPDEKVGNFCLIDGRVSVIEYSDMPQDLAQAREGDGLRFNAGSIAIHAISVDFVESLNEDDSGRFALPYHRALKKVPYLDLESRTQKDPAEVNAVKLEMFVFDALPLASKSIILETDRVDEFAPIKNAKGTDSAETSRQLQSQRAARWLAARGVALPFKDGGEVDAVIELSPLTAIAPEDLADVDLPTRIAAGDEVTL